VANSFYGAIDYVGGTAGDLDAISVSVLEDNDVCILVDVANKTFSVYAGVTADSGVVDLVGNTILKPADEAATPGYRWYLCTVYEGP